MFGAGIGYFYRYRVQLRRVMTLLIAMVIFVLLEITSGTLSSKYTIGENLREQFSLLLPFPDLVGLNLPSSALRMGQGLDLPGKTALPKPPTFEPRRATPWTLKTSKPSST